MFLSGDGQRDVAVSPRAPTARPPTGYCLVLLGLQVNAAILRLLTSTEIQRRREPSKYIDVLSDKHTGQCLSNVENFKRTSGIKHFLH